jgi:hypothetical protein
MGRNVIVKVMAAVDESFEQRTEHSIRSLSQLHGQGFKLASAADDGRFSIVFGSHVKPESCV